MEGDQIDSLFEKKTQEFIDSLDRKKVVADPDQPKDEVIFIKKPAESAAGTSMTREMKERHDFEEGQRKRAVAEGAPVSGMSRPLEHVVDSLSRNVGPLNGRETKVTRSPLLDGLEGLEKMAKSSAGKTVMTDYPSADELEIRFKFHAADEVKAARHRDVRMRCWALAEFLTKECPPSRELSLALTKVEEVMLWANAAIARRG